MIVERWIERADRALDVVARSVESARPTPENFTRELARLTTAWSLPRADASPRFTYGPRRALDRERDALSALRAWIPDGAPLAELYVARVDELLLEADLASAPTSATRRALAAQRFGDASGDALARAWLAEAGAVPVEPDDEPSRSDDARDPRSLLSSMKRELGRALVPVRVVARAGLASLAAHKDGVVYVAKDRLVGRRATRRTVHHEVHGHAVPFAASTRASLGLARIGAARGADDQEGWALVLEERAGFLDRGRKSELAARHVAAVHAHDGARFADATRALLSAGIAVDVAVRAALRAYRGAEGDEGGLGRERVYLSGFVRVHRAIAEDPELERWIASGRISVEAARALSRAT